MFVWQKHANHKRNAEQNTLIEVHNKYSFKILSQQTIQTTLFACAGAQLFTTQTHNPVRRAHVQHTLRNAFCNSNSP